MSEIYDKTVARIVLDDIQKGLKTGEFINWNSQEGKKMANQENTETVESTQTTAKANRPKTTGKRTKSTKKATTPKSDRGPGRPANVTEKAFLELWNNASNLDEVAVALSSQARFQGRDHTAVKLYASMRATQLRKKLRASGSDLKAFPRGARKATEDSDA